MGRERGEEKEEVSLIITKKKGTAYYLDQRKNKKEDPAEDREKKRGTMRPYWGKGETSFSWEKASVHQYPLPSREKVRLLEHRSSIARKGNKNVISKTILLRWGGEKGSLCRGERDDHPRHPHGQRRPRETSLY